MKPNFLLFALVILLYPLAAIDLNLPASAAHNATNNLNLLYPTPAAMAMNPAISKKGVETSATYLFNLEELPKYDLHFVLPYRNWQLHLGDSYLDHEFYQENNAALGLNYTLSKITAGVSLRLLNSNTTGYQNASAYLVDAGLKWEAGSLTTALAVRNLSQTEFEGVLLPLVYLWESCYQLTAKSRLGLGLEKESDFDFSFKFAGRYDLFRAFTLLSSYQFEPNRLGVGAVFRLAGFELVYSVRTHQYIDLTHYISLSYEIFN